MKSAQDSAERLDKWRRWLPRLARILIALIVALGVGRRLWSERERLALVAQDVQPSWLALSAAAYLAGLSTCALFWWWSIRDQSDRPGLLATWTAYFAGHLGKYVPGKGLVVVIRAGLLRDSNVSLATGTISCAHETLLMMATGCLVAAILVPMVSSPSLPYLLVAAIVMLVGLGVPSLPPAVTWWSGWIIRPFMRDTTMPAYRSRWRTFGRGVVIISVGWFLMGLSLGAVLQATGAASVLVDRMGMFGTVCFLTAVVAISTVGGFLSFLPGGLGSREWILVETLVAALGIERTGEAAVAAILLRVVWIVAELTGTALFWLLDRSWNNRHPVTH